MTGAALSSELTLRTRPYLHRLRQRLGRAHRVSPCHAQVIQPAEEQGPARYGVLPEALERLVRAPPETSLHEQLRPLMGQPRRHLPVVLNTVEDVIVHAGGVDGRHGPAIAQAELQLDALSFGPLPRLESLLFAGGGATQRRLDSWMEDGLPVLCAAAPGQPSLLPNHRAWGRADGYLRLFGLREQPRPPIHVQRLNYLRDAGFGSHKRARYAALKRRLREAVRARFADLMPPHRKLFFCGAAERGLIGREACELALLQDGYEILDPAHYTPIELQRRISEAELVVCRSGPQLSEALYGLPAGGAIISLIEADRFQTRQLPVASAMGVRAGLVVLSPDAQGYRLEATPILRTAELTAGLPAPEL